MTPATDCIYFDCEANFDNKELQPWTNYLRQTLFFMRNTALRDSSISIFQQFFGSIGKIFIFGVGLGTRLYFNKVLRFFCISEFS